MGRSSTFALTFLAALPVTALSANSAKAITISNASQANNIIFPFGSPDTTTYGQSFTSPGGFLDSFSFTLSNVASGNARFVLAPLSGNTPGVPLYSSASFAVQNGVNTVSGINTATVLGTSYLAYFTVAGVSNPTPRPVGFALSIFDSYAGGSLMYLNSDGADPTGKAFTNISSYDFAFTAVFNESPTSVPEPASLALLGAGMIGLGLTKRRKVA